MREPESDLKWANKKKMDRNWSEIGPKNSPRGLWSTPRQLNIDMTSKEINDIFDEVNTDPTEIDGKQVIDEREFLAFYHSLMEREVLHKIFDQVFKWPLFLTLEF